MFIEQLQHAWHIFTAEYTTVNKSDTIFATKRKLGLLGCDRKAFGAIKLTRPLTDEGSTMHLASGGAV